MALISCSVSPPSAFEENLCRDSGYASLNGIGPKGGKLDKVKVASELSPYITRVMISKHLDLPSRLDAVCEKIRLWNGIDPMPSPS